MHKYLLFLLPVLFLAGCYQISPDDEDLRTVPTTNNPNLVPGPQRSNPLPSMPY